MATFNVGDIVSIQNHKTRPELNYRNCQITGGIIEFNHAKYYPVALKDEPDEIFNVKASYLTTRRPSNIPEIESRDLDQSSSCETPQHHDTGIPLETGSSDHHVPVDEILKEVVELNQGQMQQDPDASFMVSRSYHPQFCQKYCTLCAKHTCFLIFFCIVWHLAACVGIGIGISLIVKGTELSVTATKDECVLISYEEQTCQYLCNCTTNTNNNCNTCVGSQYTYFATADKCNNATLEGAFADMDCPQTLLQLNAPQTCYIKDCRQSTFSMEAPQISNDMMVPIGIGVVAVSALVLLAPCCCYRHKNPSDTE